MLILFFDEQGMVFRHWVPQGQGVNGRLYWMVMEQLREAMRRRRAQHRHSWALLHDNALAHHADCVQNFLQAAAIPQIPHPHIALTSCPVTTGFVLVSRG